LPPAEADTSFEGRRGTAAEESIVRLWSTGAVD
jgi:hypothetical protein